MIDYEHAFLVDADQHRHILVADQAHQTANGLLHLAVKEGGTVGVAHTRNSTRTLVHHIQAKPVSVKHKTISPVEWQRPTKLQILAHQFARCRRRGHPLELLQQPDFGGRAAADRQPRPAGAACHVGGQKSRLIFAKKRNAVRVRVVRPELDARLDAAQHDRVGWLHDVAAGQHVVARLLVQQLDNARISVREG